MNIFKKIIKKFSKPERYQVLTAKEFVEKAVTTQKIIVPIYENTTKPIYKTTRNHLTAKEMVKKAIETGEVSIPVYNLDKKAVRIRKRERGKNRLWIKRNL